MGNIGVYVCECGPNIKDRIDIDKVIEKISSTEDIKIIKRFPLLCSNDGKTFLEEEIKKEGITHLVVAACSPKDHELTFMGVCTRAGINPYLLQMINIREQCAWTTSDREEATHKAIKAIRAGIGRVARHDPLVSKEVEITPDVLVIGGGPAGLEAALSLAGKNREVYLVEKEESLGGKSKHLHQLLPHQGTSPDLILNKIAAVEENPAITVITSSEVTDIRGFLGNFEVTITGNDGTSSSRDLKAGAIVVATGFELFDIQKTERYGRGKLKNVLTSLEFEAKMKSGEIALENGETPGSVALIHCAGRKESGYCSKTCCLYLLRAASFIKDQLPETEVLEFASDLCLPHKDDQDFFEEAKKKGVRFLRPEDEVALSDKDGRVEIAYTTGGKRETQTADMVVLAPAMIPSPSTRGLADKLNIPLDESGFFKEVHELLNPVATPVEGVYIVGCASGPKNIPESLIQSQAAAAKIFASLIPGQTIKTEARVCEVRAEFCTGCQTCLTVCFYGAISFDEFKGVSVVNEAICRGCASCVGSCPSGAIRAKHFMDGQIYREVVEALR